MVHLVIVGEVFLQTRCPYCCPTKTNSIITALNRYSTTFTAEAVNIFCNTDQHHSVNKATCNQSRLPLLRSVLPTTEM